MGDNIAWCTWSYQQLHLCTEHDIGHPHHVVTSPLGPNDEPQYAGALVVAWAGEYRCQEVWVNSGANVGNWYCLGNEFRRPQIWDPPSRDFLFLHRQDAPELPRPVGSIPSHPTWHDVLHRGPVSLLSTDSSDAYRTGWRNGRRNLSDQIAGLAENDPDTPAETEVVSSAPDAG